MMCPIRQHRMKRIPSLLSITIISLQICIAATSNYHSDQFPSSIITNNNNDVQHSHGLRLHRSFIDRDPIYYEENGLINSISEVDDEDVMFDEVIQHYSSQQQQTCNNNKLWQSPLESLYPLPTLSLDSSQSSGSSSIDISAAPIIINPGSRHKHEIDIHDQTNNNNDSSHPKKLKTRKTGTTITALLAQNSTVLILAADTRATDGSTVADKRCEKLHSLANNVWCAGAGTSADVEALVRRVKFIFWKRGMMTSSSSTSAGIGSGNIIMNSDTTTTATTESNTRHNWRMDTTISNEDRHLPSASVPAILHYIRTQLQKSRGNLGVNLLVGGYDHETKHAHLAAIHPHGSMDIVNYAALGSGGLAATGVLESKYPRRIGSCSIQEGIQLAVDAVKAGIDNDLGSGSQVDVCVISSEGVLYRRAVVSEEEIEWISIHYDYESKGDDSDDRQSQIQSGVVGFGNVPFSITSKKLVSGGEMGEVESERRRFMDNILGKR